MDAGKCQIQNGRMVQKAFRKMSCQKSIQRSCTTTSRTWQAGDPYKCT